MDEIPSADDIREQGKSPDDLDAKYLEAVTKYVAREIQTNATQLTNGEHIIIADPRLRGVYPQGMWLKHRPSLKQMLKDKGYWAEDYSDHGQPCLMVMLERRK